MLDSLAVFLPLGNVSHFIIKKEPIYIYMNILVCVCKYIYMWV